jgi:hypothetical protein
MDDAAIDLVIDEMKLHAKVPQSIVHFVTSIRKTYQRSSAITNHSISRKLSIKSYKWLAWRNIDCPTRNLVHNQSGSTDCFEAIFKSMIPNVLSESPSPDTSRA